MYEFEYRKNMEFSRAVQSHTDFGEEHNLLLKCFGVNDRRSRDMNGNWHRWETLVLVHASRRMIYFACIRVQQSYWILDSSPQWFSTESTINTAFNYFQPKKDDKDRGLLRGCHNTRHIFSFSFAGMRKTVPSVSSEQLANRLPLRDSAQ